MMAENGFELFMKRSPFDVLRYVSTRGCLRRCYFRTKGQSNCIAGDTVKAMWLMLQQDEPEDFVISSGQLHTIQNCLDVAFSYLGIEWENYVRADLEFVRTLDAKPLLTDPTQAKKILGWQPKLSFEELIEMMVKADMEALDNQ